MRRSLMNDVMTFVTMTGEIIGRLRDESPDAYTVENPRLFGQTEQGVGFVPGVCMTGKREPKTAVLNKAAVTCVVETDDQLIKAWQQQTTGLVLP